MPFAPLELDENATPMQKEMWRIKANNTIKHKELLEANLEAMYEVILSICDPWKNYYGRKYNNNKNESYEE